MADWLHRELERFRVPSQLVGRLTEHGAVPRRLTPIFRDRQELAAAKDLGNEIREALAASRFLIVLCSPAAAASKWTNAEVDSFKRVHPEGCVLAAIVAGEPFASDIPGREAEECLPPALRVEYDRRGRPTRKRSEPLAADLREAGDGRRLGLLKLVAGLIGVGLDDLVQREALRRQRRLATLSSASLAGMIVASVLAVTAIDARDAARDQRREAESLIGFMVGDLRSKLEPVGRLDALDSVAARALAYYQKQDTQDLSDESLTQRAKALTMMGEVATARGDLDSALRLYREAFATTREALRRAPGDPERLFDHAQNVYWVGYIDFQRGALDRAEAAFREYGRLADAMVAIEPDNSKWRLEQTYAANNLGVLLIERTRYREAATAFAEALRVSEALLALQPDSRAYQDRALEGMAWLAQALASAGQLQEALDLRTRQLGFIDSLRASRGADPALRIKAMVAHRAVGRLLASRGDRARGLAHVETAASLAEQAMRADRENAGWAESGAQILFDLGELRLAIGLAKEAAAPARAGCDIADRLAKQDSTVVEWRAELPGRCLRLRAGLALAGNTPAEAQALARRLVSLARSERAKRPSFDSDLALAEAEMLAGDIAYKLGDPASARTSWAAAAAAWPKSGELTPRELAVRAALLKRLGQQGESQRIAARLAAIGYQHPTYLAAMKQEGQAT